MTQIVATDRALVRLLESCDFAGTTIASAPHEWDPGFIGRLLSSTPTILVCFLGAEDPDSKLTELNLDGRWACYVCVGWNGTNQEQRRLGVGAGFTLMHAAAAALHNAVLTDENGERLPIVEVEGLSVETDSSVDITNLWVGGIALKIELPLPLLETDQCFGPLDDFLRVRATFDLPGAKPAPDIADVGTEGDVPMQTDLPQ